MACSNCNCIVCTLNLTFLISIPDIIKCLMSISVFEAESSAANDILFLRGVFINVKQHWNGVVFGFHYCQHAW